MLYKEDYILDLYQIVLIAVGGYLIIYYTKDNLGFFILSLMFFITSTRNIIGYKYELSMRWFYSGRIRHEVDDEKKKKFRTYVLYSSIAELFASILFLIAGLMEIR